MPLWAQERKRNIQVTKYKCCAQNNFSSRNCYAALNEYLFSKHHLGGQYKQEAYLLNSQSPFSDFKLSLQVKYHSLLNWQSEERNTTVRRGPHTIQNGHHRKVYKIEAGEGGKKGNPPRLLVGMEVGAASVRTVWKVLKKLKIELQYDSAIPLLSIHLEKTLI